MGPPISCRATSCDSRQRAASFVGEIGPAQPPTPRLLERVRAAVRLRHDSRRTEEAYAAWVRRYVLSHGKRHPAERWAQITLMLFPDSLGVRSSLDTVLGPKTRIAPSQADGIGRPDRPRDSRGEPEVAGDRLGDGSHGEIWREAGRGAAVRLRAGQRGPQVSQCHTDRPSVWPTLSWTTRD